MTTQEWKFTAKDIAVKTRPIPIRTPRMRRLCTSNVLAVSYESHPRTNHRHRSNRLHGSRLFIYPYTSWAVPWLHTAFETAAANASGIDAALKAFERKGKVKRTH